MLDSAVQNKLLEILAVIKKGDLGGFFLEPVDPIQLQIPDYHKIITHPMDLGTIETKLRTSDKNSYSSVKEFYDDVILVFTNAEKYNHKNSEVYKDSKKLRKVFNDKYKTFDSWHASHTPAVKSRKRGASQMEEDHEEPTTPTTVPYVDRCRLSKRIVALDPPNLGKIVKIFQNIQPQVYNPVPQSNGMKAILDVDGLTFHNFRVVSQATKKCLRRQLKQAAEKAAA
eukprot:Platyproteum_vivax@DN3947_c0_g1_i1.p1